jgi:hypothetical protein
VLPWHLPYAADETHKKFNPAQNSNPEPIETETEVETLHHSVR